MDGRFGSPAGRWSLPNSSKSSVQKAAEVKRVKISFDISEERRWETAAPILFYAELLMVVKTAAQEQSVAPG
jgi:hypothetical protein